MDIKQAILEGWAWQGCRPESILAVNQFGNVIFTDLYGSYWRLMPEELRCEVIATDANAFAVLWADAEFQVDWTMERLVRLAREAHGELPEGSSYYFLLPHVLGGSYLAENIRIIVSSELALASGILAEQIKDMPDGTVVEIDTTD